jgi:hypothetical protein
MYVAGEAQPDLATERRVHEEFKVLVRAPWILL